jgi:hypothetical protein
MVREGGLSAAVGVTGVRMSVHRALEPRPTRLGER